MQPWLAQDTYFKNKKITDKIFERKLFCSYCNYLFINLQLIVFN